MKRLSQQLLSGILYRGNSASSLFVVFDSNFSRLAEVTNRFPLKRCSEETKWKKVLSSCNNSNSKIAVRVVFRFGESIASKAAINLQASCEFLAIIDYTKSSLKFKKHGVHCKDLSTGKIAMNSITARWCQILIISVNQTSIQISTNSSLFLLQEAQVFLFSRKRLIFFYEFSTSASVKKHFWLYTRNHFAALSYPNHQYRTPQTI